MWNDLTMSQKAEIISMAVKAGMKDMDSIQSFYNNTTGSGRVFDKGGYKSSASIRKRITNWEGASMHTKAPDTGKVNNSFEFEERAFWNTLPKVVRDNATQEELDALFSTSYNIGSGNFRKRVVPQLVRLYSGTGTIEDVQASMYGNRDKEPKMVGLRKRRATEREMFGRAYTASHNLHSAHAAVEDAMKAVEAMPINTSPIVDYMPRQTPTIDESINNVVRPEVEGVSILKPNSDSLFKSVANLPVPQPISIQPSSRQDTGYQMTVPEVVYSQPYLDMMAEIKDSMTFARGGYLTYKKLLKKKKGIDADRDITYDYQGFYNENPKLAKEVLKDKESHFPDTYKTIYHPTFSTESKYSGKIDKRYNPKGLVGGTWEDDHTYRMSYDGYRSPISMDERKAYLENAENNGVQLLEADGSLPVYDGISWGGVLPTVTIKPKRFDKR